MPPAPPSQTGAAAAAGPANLPVAMLADHPGQQIVGQLDPFRAPLRLHTQQPPIHQQPQLGIRQSVNANRVADVARLAETALQNQLLLDLRRTESGISATVRW